MISFNLNKKIALITGASRGIGEAIAITMSEFGAICILTSRNMDGLMTVKAKIEERGGEAEVVTCHTGKPEMIRQLFERVKLDHGRLDILVNNAATNPYFGEMTDAPEWAWDKTVAVNLKGPFFMIQQAVELMTKNGGGSIVNIASVNGVRPAPLQGIYAITKAGVIAMTKAYAKELAGKNIRVNALLPGLTETKLAAALIENREIYDRAMKRIPMQRHAQPHEMVGAVLYLVSDAATYTTGTSIICDGGMLA